MDKLSVCGETRLLHSSLPG